MAAPMTKTDFIFPAFSSRFVDFAVQFCFRCKFSFNEDDARVRLTVARFFWTNHNSLLRIASNEIASFWKDHRSRQMAFFPAKAGQRQGKRPALTLCWKFFEIKKAFRYYIKQIDSMIPCVWFSNRLQKTSKCGKNISDSTHHILTSSVIYIWTDARQHEIYLLMLFILSSV